MVASSQMVGVCMEEVASQGTKSEGNLGSSLCLSQRTLSRFHGPRRDPLSPSEVCSLCDLKIFYWPPLLKGPKLFSVSPHLGASSRSWTLGCHPESICKLLQLLSELGVNVKLYLIPKSFTSCVIGDKLVKCHKSLFLIWDAILVLRKIISTTVRLLGLTA